MAGVVRHQIEPRIACLQPPGEQVDRQREAVHLGEQRDDERTEGAE